MELHFNIIGVLLVGLALIHVVFPKYFSWKQELGPLSIMNRQMMYIHSFFIAFVVLLMGLLCLTSSNDLTETPFGRKVSLGLGIFWVVRLFVQLFGYSPKVWKGKTFETAVHILFSILWIYFSTVFFLTYFSDGH